MRIIVDYEDENQENFILTEKDWNGLNEDEKRKYILGTIDLVI